MQLQVVVNVEEHPGVFGRIARFPSCDQRRGIVGCHGPFFVIDAVFDLFQHNVNALH